MTDQAFVTLTTNDAYAKDAPVLGSSLKQHRTTRRLVMLAILQVSDSMRKVLETVFDEVIMVDVLDSGNSAHLTLMKRPELGVMLAKLHCWFLTQYSQCIFMDADTLVLANTDAFFEREELSALDLYILLLKCLGQVPKLCISWDESNRGIILMIPKRKVSKVSPMIPI
uniref:Glycogenin 1 n=1 Tax=Aotus nancymaae TaxID=37293 RepID=A0A2K5BZ49_AOTNA